MKKIFVFLIVCGLVGWLLIPLQAQQDRSIKPDRPVVRTIDRAYFPEDEYPSDQYEGMIIPDGPGPICPPPNTLPNGGWTRTEPAINDSGLGCRMPGLVTFGGGDTLGFSGGTPRKTKNNVTSAAPNSTLVYYTNLNDCRDANSPCDAANEGVNKVYFSLSAKKPILNYGSANDVHFGNRMHFGGRLNGSTITCQIDGVTYGWHPNIAVISGWGVNRVNTISGDMKLLYEVFDSDYCIQAVTPFTIPQNLAVYVKIYRAQNPPQTDMAQWGVQIWWNNQWTLVTTEWVSFDEGMFLDYGLEYDAVGNDYGRAKIPRNFVGNVSYKTDQLQSSGYTGDSYPFDSSFLGFYPHWYDNYYYVWNSPFIGQSTMLQPNDQSSMMARSID